MKSPIFKIIGSVILVVSFLSAQKIYEKDIIPTDKGDLEITFIGHGTLMFEYDNKTIHIDPAGMFGDFSNMPKADLILVTHQHGDHLDAETIDLIKQADTGIILTAECYKKYPHGMVMENGDTKDIKGIHIEAVPAYNLVHKRKNGQVFHPRGEGNGYILTLGGKRVYIGGDTENFPEMKKFENIDIAFLPMNLPYTMTPEMVADAVMMFKPKILYPYHYGDSDLETLVDLLKDQNSTELRLRKMK